MPLARKRKSPADTTGLPQQRPALTAAPAFGPQRPGVTPPYLTLPSGIIVGVGPNVPAAPTINRAYYSRPVPSPGSFVFDRRQRQWRRRIPRRADLPAPPEPGYWPVFNKAGVIIGWKTWSTPAGDPRRSFERRIDRVNRLTRFAQIGRRAIRRHRYSAAAVVVDNTQRKKKEARARQNLRARIRRWLARKRPVVPRNPTAAESRESRYSRRLATITEDQLPRVIYWDSKGRQFVRA